ncbi:MAG: hemolysin family protein [Clostridia bacterium]
MEDPGSSILILLMFILLSFSALFSGSETSYFGLTNYRLRELKEEGSEKAKKISNLLDKPDELLTTLLVGNTAVNIAFTSSITVLIIALTSGFLTNNTSSFLATIVSAGMLLIFGEVTPKAFAADNSELFAFKTVNIIRLIKLILSPITFVVNLATKVFLGSKNNQRQFRDDIITEDIIKTAVMIGEEYGSVEEDEKNIIYNIFKSTDTSVLNVMIPKSEIVMVKEESSLKEAAIVLAEEGYTRLPVLSEKGNKEFICGIVYAKDLLLHLKNKEYDIPVAQVMRAPSYCRPNKKAVDLLVQMRENGRHMSIVRDTKGEILGLVTLEDLLEVIVGDIIDEYDYDEMNGTNDKGGEQ